MTEYHEPSSCNKCKGLNKFTNEVWEESVMYETRTECTKCGHKDYWAYGFFESGSDMKSNCDTYSFDK